MHLKFITMVRLDGFFKEVYSGNGNPLVPFCGYTENVRSSHSLLPDNSWSSLDLVAGSGKSILWFVLLPFKLPSKFIWSTQFFDHTRPPTLARCRDGLDGLLLFRL